MLHHIEIYVSNLEASHAFWTKLLANIGYKQRNKWRDGFTVTNGENPYLTFVQVTKKYKTLNYHRCGVGLNHLAFTVKSVKAVDDLRKHCIENGIICLYDERYPYATGKGYYALFVEDPDRIKVEFVVES